MQYELGLVFNHRKRMTVQCSGEQSLRDAIVKAMIPGIPRGCGGGGCGICKVKILHGDVELKRMSSDHISKDDIKNRTVLACCARPKTNVDLSFCNLDI